ncbi:MAG: hypothetical protein ACFB0C_15805 [Leptolyngbyaceae cyanobacterium]
MYKIVCADPALQQKLSKPEQYFIPEVLRELSIVLQALKRDGTLAGTDFYDTNTNKVSMKTFYLFYKPRIYTGEDGEISQEILLIDLKTKSSEVLKQRFSVSDNWDDKDVVESIPQYDKPIKIIAALQYIYEGIEDSFELGSALGHRGKKREYIARHGNYAKHTLEQLKLITRIKEEHHWSAHLTEKGKLIAEAPSEELKLRLLIEAMLNYPPVWRIIVAVTERQGELGDKEILTDELVKDLTFPEVLRDSDTSKRRAQTLRNWIKWISDYSGIPIWLHKDGVQLLIPMLYAENKI